MRPARELTDLGRVMAVMDLRVIRRRGVAPTASRIMRYSTKSHHLKAPCSRNGDPFTRN